MSYIINAQGDREIFDSRKLEQSLRNSGADEQRARDIVHEVSKRVTSNMTTAEIRRTALTLLKRVSPSAVYTYSLRKALLKLGPTGFPFEQIVGEIFRRKGYSVETNMFVDGKCASHEVDVLAYKDYGLAIEAKFHNEISGKTDLKTALYVKARFEDLNLAKTYVRSRREPVIIGNGKLITNTKFTSSAISYARCAGLDLVGWNYPDIGNLHHLIVETGVHPVSSLASLSQKDVQRLLEQKIIYISELKHNPQALNSIPMDTNKRQLVLKELQEFNLHGI